MIVANGIPAWTRFGGNNAATQKFLAQTGTGAVSALPTWHTFVQADITDLPITCPNATGLFCLAGRAGGQTASGGTLTTQNLTLRANAADTTTGIVTVDGVNVNLNALTRVGDLTVPINQLEVAANATLGQAPTVATTLNGALSAGATTIPVVATAGYSVSGIAFVDKEAFSYTSVDATDFLGVTRGVYGTTAASHLTAASVYQSLLSVIASSTDFRLAVIGATGGGGEILLWPKTFTYNVAAGTVIALGAIFSNSTVNVTNTGSPVGVYLTNIVTYNTTAANNLAGFIPFFSAVSQRNVSGTAITIQGNTAFANDMILYADNATMTVGNNIGAFRDHSALERHNGGTFDAAASLTSFQSIIDVPGVCQTGANKDLRCTTDNTNASTGCGAGATCPGCCLAPTLVNRVGFQYIEGGGIGSTTNAKAFYIAGMTNTTGQKTSLESDATNVDLRHAGNVRIGDITAPTDQLEVVQQTGTSSASYAQASLLGKAQTLNTNSVSSVGLELGSINNVSTAYTATVDQSSSLFTGIKLQPTIKSNGSARTVGTFYALRNLINFDTNNANLTVTISRTFSDELALTQTTSGIVTLSEYTSFMSNPTNAVTTHVVTARRGLWFRDFFFAAPTVGTEIAVDVDSLANTGTFTVAAAVRSAITSGTGKWFLLSTANADSSFGGNLFVGNTGSVVPAATIHAQQPTAGNDVFRQETVDTTSNPTCDYYQKRVTTTGAASGTFTVATSGNGNGYSVSVVAVANCNGGTSCTAAAPLVEEYFGRGAFRTNNAATLLNTGNETTVLAGNLTGALAADVALSASGANIVTTVTGHANENDTWGLRVMVCRIAG